MSAPRPDDSGSSLVDILLAVGIMGVAMASIVGGMMTASIGADVSRQTAEAQQLTRTYAESVAADTYVGCATSYPATGFSLPAGFVRTTVVTYWNGTTFASACPATDSGLQRVSVTIKSSDDRAADTLLFTKRVKPTGETP
jgi:Tfp pilus assembly protein PilV